MALLYLTSVLFGLIIGSFMNVCIFRIPEGRSIVNPPSACMNCGNRLKAYHNIPVLSYLVLGGRCAFCGTSISVQYPLVELVNGGMYALALYIFGPGYQAVGSMLMASAFIVCMVVSFERSSVPVSLAGFVFAMGLLLGVFAMGYGISEAMLGSVVGAVGAYLASLITGQSDAWSAGLVGGSAGALTGICGAAVLVVAAVLLWSLAYILRLAGGFKAVRMFTGFISLSAIVTLFGRLGEWVACL